jgi:hypothetical protein
MPWRKESIRKVQIIKTGKGKKRRIINFIRAGVVNLSERRANHK